MLFDHRCTLIGAYKALSCTALASLLGVLCLTLSSAGFLPLASRSDDRRPHICSGSRQVEAEARTCAPPPSLAPAGSGLGGCEWTCTPIRCPRLGQGHHGRTSRLQVRVPPWARARPCRVPLAGISGHRRQEETGAQIGRVVHEGWRAAGVCAPGSQVQAPPAPLHLPVTLLWLSLGPLLHDPALCSASSCVPGDSVSWSEADWHWDPISMTATALKQLPAAAALYHQQEQEPRQQDAAAGPPPQHPAGCSAAGEALEDYVRGLAHAGRTPGGASKDGGAANAGAAALPAAGGGSGDAGDDGGGSDPAPASSLQPPGRSRGGGGRQRKAAPTSAASVPCVCQADGCGADLSSHTYYHQVSECQWSGGLCTPQGLHSVMHRWIVLASALSVLWHVSQGLCRLASSAAWQPHHAATVPPSLPGWRS